MIQNTASGKHFTTPRPEPRAGGESSWVHVLMYFNYSRDRAGFDICVCVDVSACPVRSRYDGNRFHSVG